MKRTVHDYQRSPATETALSVVLAVVLAGLAAVLFGLAAAGLSFIFFEDPDEDFYGFTALVYGVGAACFAAAVTYIAFGARAIFANLQPKQRSLPLLALLAAPPALYWVGRNTYVVIDAATKTQANVYAVVVIVIFALVGPAALVWSVAQLQGRMFHRTDTAKSG